MKKNAILFLLFTSFFLFYRITTAFSQSDSTSVQRTFNALDKLFPGQTSDLNSITNDSLLVNSQFYDRSQQKKVFVPRTGNPGSATFWSGDHSLDLKFYNAGFNQFNDYLLHPLKVEVGDKPFTRFTNIDYHLGSKKEQHIFLKHEQKIKPWFVAGFDFGALSSQGDFSRQLNTNRNFDIYVAYEAPSSVYKVYSSFTSNRILNQENGGITTDSVFEKASNLDTRTLPINLQNASTKHRTRDYLLHQELNLSRLFTPRDSSMKNFNDNSFVLATSSWWSRHSVLFTSSLQDSGYFANTYYDSVQTYDSSFVDDLYNAASLTYSTISDNKHFSFYIGVGAENQSIKYFSYESDTSREVTSATFSTGFNWFALAGKFSFIKAITGDCSDCYRSNLEFYYSFNQKKDLAVLSLAAYKSPQNLNVQYYNSNHFRWKNNFDNLERYEINAGFNISKYKLNFLVQNSISKNQVFYREDYLPQIYKEYLSVTALSAAKILIVGNFGWDNKLEFNFSGNENVVSLPLFAVYSSIYFEKNVFKNAMGFKGGVDVNYFSEYYGYGYMPATGIFYLQNEKKIGNYPRLGAYINLRIKTARIFVKVENINSGIGDRTYYGAFHYPLPGRTLKFGVNWTFKD